MKAKFMFAIFVLLILNLYGLYDRFNEEKAISNDLWKYDTMRNAELKTKILVKSTLIGMPTERLVASLDSIVSTQKGEVFYKTPCANEIEYFPWRIKLEDEYVKEITMINDPSSPNEAGCSG